MLVSRGDRIQTEKASSVLFVFISLLFLHVTDSLCPYSGPGETSNGEKPWGGREEKRSFRFPRVSYPYLRCTYSRTRQDLKCIVPWGLAIDTKSQEPLRSSMVWGIYPFHSFRNGSWNWFLFIRLVPAGQGVILGSLSARPVTEKHTYSSLEA